MKVIGITGGLGTGKSTVAHMFAARGALVIDADALVHRALKPGGSCYAKVVKAFGKDILDGREIDREKLAAIVFRHPARLKELTSIIHPILEKEVKAKIGKVPKNSKTLVVVDAPLLIEAGWRRWVDYLIVVRASKALAIRRVSAHKNISQAEINRRMKAQMPIAQKIKMADIVIDNRKHLQETQRHVEKIITVLLNRM